MPGSKGEGRPKSKLFMKLGKVEVHRPDSLNWSVEDGDVVHYYPRLPGAIREAVERAAEGRAKDAVEWLEEYDKIERRLVGTIRKALEGWKE